MTNDVDPLNQLEELARLEDDLAGAPDDLRAAVVDLFAESVGSRRSRVFVLVVATASVAVVIGSSVGIAALLRRQPERPEHGPACRGGPSLDSPVYILGPNADPLADCAELWRTGVLPADGEGDGSVPPLVACVGQNGALEIYPGPSDQCVALGLEPAAVTPDAQTDAIETLSTRIAEDINLAECAGEDDVRNQVQSLLAELQLDGWTIDPNPDVAEAPCVKAQVDSSSKVVHLFRI